MSAPATVTEAHRQAAVSIFELAMKSSYHGAPFREPCAQLIADSEAKAVAEWQDSAHLKGEAIDSLLLECDKLRADADRILTDGVECLRRAMRAEAKIGNQAERIRHLEGATNHATGTPLSQAIARAERAEAELKEWSLLNLWGGTPEIIHNFVKGQQARIHAAQDVEAELAGIRALADRRNKRDHSQDTTHQLVAALDQALDIAQAELAQFRELDAERARMRQIAVDKRIRTPTPRTDEEAGSLIDAEEVVPADFARELERELAKERARLDWLDNHLNYELMITVFGEEIGIASDGGPCELRSAIDAAMKEETK